MILIFTNRVDKTAGEVADWLRYYKKKMILADEHSKIELLFADINDKKISILIDNKFVSLDEVESIWFRKIPFKTELNKIDKCEYVQVSFHINEFMVLENQMINEYISRHFKFPKRTIGRNDRLYVNKLVQLEKAKEVGFEIPKTIIISSSSDLKKIQNKKVITKGLFESLSFNDLNLQVFSGTEMVDMESYKNEKSLSFAPSLFQEYIPKFIEIRTFYLKNISYSMAIFSQSNEKTKIDYRNYDFQKINRMVPFQLPILIRKKINKLMKLLELDSGSIDLIFSSDFKYYFLEVNPVGQFGFVSHLCNYYLEKKISQYLCKDE